MKKIFCTLVAAAMAFTGIMAQEAESTEKCMENASLFTSYAKAKDYASALEFWEAVYRDCPNATKNIYIYGVRIVEWQISQAQDDAQRTALINKLMKVYDDQVTYYGQTEAQAAAIKAKKANSYAEYFPEDRATAYQMMKEAIQTLGLSTDPAHLLTYIIVSEELYRKDNSLAEQYINDYTMVGDILNTNSNNEELKNRANYQLVKENSDARFAASGVATCEKMNEVFGAKIEENKDNAEYLKTVRALFDNGECYETEAYRNLATYLYNIEPSFDAAYTLAKMWYNKKEYKTAVEYLQESIKLSNGEKTDGQYLLLGLCYDKLSNDAKAKESYKKSLEINPNQAVPYIQIAAIYASARVSDDPVLQRAVYWAAVDQLLKARNVSGITAAQLEMVNERISKYSAQFPSKEQVFMHNEIEAGKSYFVGGIVSETTTVRTK